MKQVIKLIKFFVGWPLSLIALFFLWKIFTPQLSVIDKNFKHANFLILILSLCAFEIYFFFRVLLWQKILESKGHNIPLNHTAWHWSIAEINRYIPGNVWSIIGRGAKFGKFGIKQSTLLTAWLQESILIVLGSSLVGLFGLGYALSNVLPNFPLKNIIYPSLLFLIPFVGVIWMLQYQIKKMSFVLYKIDNVFTDSSTSLSQLIISTVSFFFFGLGTYLSINSIFYLPIQHVMLLVGLFSLSFTIGYLSFITPMGLGVREFVISSGLIYFLTKTLVGFASIFSRFFLIVSEFIFLFLAFIFIKSKIILNKNLVFNIKKYKYEYLLGVSTALYTAYFTTASFLRYTNFFTGRFDLGNMDQTVWNTIHGKIFMLTDPNGTNIMSRLGTHADFILILISPFYLLWEDPRMLLFLQTISLALGAIFVFLIGKELLKNKNLSFIFSLVYLLNPSIQFSNLYDFHSVTFATTFFLAAWYFILKKKYFWMFLFLVFAGLTKEEVWIIIGFFGIFLFLFKQKRILGLTTSIMSFSLFYLLVWKFIPLARGGQHFALSYYSDFGSTPTGVITNIFFSPLKTFAIFATRTKLAYFIELFLPLSFLSVLSPQILIFALPDLGINLLSNNIQLQQIYYQYTADITPFLFIAAIYTLKNILQKYRQVPTIFYGTILMVCAILGAYFYGPLPGSLHPNIDMFVKQEDDRFIIEKFLQNIPSYFSVAATNNIGSHLSHRQYIYTIPVGIDKADIVVFLLNDEFAQPSLAAQKQMAEKLKQDKNYMELFQRGDFVAFQKIKTYPIQ